LARRLGRLPSPPETYPCCASMWRRIERLGVFAFFGHKITAVPLRATIRRGDVGNIAPFPFRRF
jgi:hypothetical protein